MACYIFHQSGSLLHLFSGLIFSRQARLTSTSSYNSARKQNCFPKWQAIPSNLWILSVDIMQLQQCFGAQLDQHLSCRAAAKMTTFMEASLTERLESSHLIFCWEMLWACLIFCKLHNYMVSPSLSWFCGREIENQPRYRNAVNIFPDASCDFSTAHGGRYHQLDIILEAGLER